MHVNILVLKSDQVKLLIVGLRHPDNAVEVKLSPACKCFSQTAIGLRDLCMLHSLCPGFQARSSGRSQHRTIPRRKQKTKVLPHTKYTELLTLSNLPFAVFLTSCHKTKPKMLFLCVYNRPSTNETGSREESWSSYLAQLS